MHLPCSTMQRREIYDIRRGRTNDGFSKIDEVIAAAYDRLQKITGDDKENILAQSRALLCLTR